MRSIFVSALAACCLILFFSAKVLAHSLDVHKNLANRAMARADSAWGQCHWLTEQYKQEVYDGSWQEDNQPPTHANQDPCRTKDHGYNPITDGTGGIFELGQIACLDPNDLQKTAKQVAKDIETAEGLWLDMLAAFEAGDLTGGDGVGAYHFLGRCCHLLQDMSSHPHVHPENIDVQEHKEYEDNESNLFDNEAFPPADGPLFPTDNLADVADATDLLDDHSSSRLLSKTYSDNDVRWFIDVAARITYFRSTFWGEVEFVEDTIGSSDGHATQANTRQTTFDDAKVDAKPNILRTMFGAENVRYINTATDDYFEITDANVNGHTWESNFDDEWFPCEGGSQDGHKTFGGVDPTDEGVRTTGRFQFANPYGGTLSGDSVKPGKNPDGSDFAKSSLGEYISWYAMKVGVRYNAGLIGAGQAAYAGTTTWGETLSGVEVRGQYDLEQTLGGPADRLDFKSYNYDASIKGWCVSIEKFTDSSSSRFVDDMTVAVVGKEAPWDTIEIASGVWVHIRVTQWLESRNSMGVKEPEWTPAQAIAARQQNKAMPDHRWSIAYPVPDPQSEEGFQHRFTMTNDDPGYDLRIVGLEFLPATTWYEDLRDVPFTGASVDLPPLTSDSTWSVDVPTTGTFIGRYIYFRYDIYDTAGTSIVCNAWGAHPVTSDPALAIPTVSEWWLAVLTLAIVAAGSIEIRRQRRAA